MMDEFMNNLCGSYNDLFLMSLFYFMVWFFPYFIDILIFTKLTEVILLIFVNADLMPAAYSSTGI